MLGMTKNCETPGVTIVHVEYKRGASCLSSLALDWTISHLTVLCGLHKGGGRLGDDTV